MLKMGATGKKISEIAFWAGIICELAVSPSGYVFGGYNEKIIILAGMLCFSVSLLLSADIKKDWKAILPVCGFGVLCFVMQRRALILRIALFLLAASGREVKKIVKLFFYGSFGIMLLGIIAAVTGDNNPMYLEELFRHEVERRYTFGFFHPNGFSFFWVRQFIMFVYLYREKLKISVMLIIEAAGVIPLLLSRSKMALALYFLIIMCDLFLRIPALKEKPEKILYIAGNIMLAAELILIYTLGIIPYPEANIGEVNNIWDLMNEATSGRLWHARDAFLSQTPGILGLKEVKEGTEIGFVNSFYHEGVLFIVIYVVLLFYLMYKMHKAKDTAGMLLILSFSFYALAESFLPYVNKNMIWIIAAAYSPWQLCEKPVDLRDEHSLKSR